MAIAGPKDSATLLDIRTGETLCRIDRHKDVVRDVVCGVAASPCGTRFASGGHGGLVQVWSQRGDVEHTFRTRPAENGGIIRLAFSPDGTRLFGGHATGVIHVWSLDPPGPLMELPGDSWTYDLAFLPTGPLLISASSRGTIQVWHAEAGKMIRRVQAHDGVRCVACTPDGRLLVSTGQDGIIKLWEMAAGQEIYRVPSRGGARISLDVSPDGRRLAVGGFEKENNAYVVRLFDIRLADGLVRGRRKRASTGSRAAPSIPPKPRRVTARPAGHGGAVPNRPLPPTPPRVLPSNHRTRGP